MMMMLSMMMLMVGGGGGGGCRPWGGAWSPDIEICCE